MLPFQLAMPLLPPAQSLPLLLFCPLVVLPAVKRSAGGVVRLAGPPKTMLSLRLLQRIFFAAHLCASRAIQAGRTQSPLSVLRFFFLSFDLSLALSLSTFVSLISASTTITTDYRRRSDCSLFRSVCCALSISTIHSGPELRLFEVTPLNGVAFHTPFSNEERFFAYVYAFFLPKSIGLKLVLLFAEMWLNDIRN